MPPAVEHFFVTDEMVNGASQDLIQQNFIIPSLCVNIDLKQSFAFLEVGSIFINVNASCI